MQYDVYKKIIEEIHRNNSRGVLSVIKNVFPLIPEMTLRSIVSQEYQRKMKKVHSKHNTDEMAALYYESYLNMAKSDPAPGFLLALSDKHDLSPALMARIVLEHHHYVITGDKLTRQQISKMLKDSTQITDKNLSADIHLCVLSDDNYGPIAEALKHSIGHQYEYKLRKHLSDLNVPFKEEDQLRAQGYDKTPDIILEMPFAVNGIVINWIESKASFGDLENHKNYLKDQFWSYWNRFGSGLVIYWFGFVDEMDEHCDKGILICDSFPLEITLMDPDTIS